MNIRAEFLAEGYENGNVGVWLAAAAGAAIAVAAGALISWLPGTLDPAPPVLSSTVTISYAAGHGSGIHIGNGLIISAAHVASEGDEVEVVTSDGAARAATVVWATLGHDIALLQTDPDALATSPLSCLPVQVGQPVTAYGAPMDMGQLTTAGHIVGVARAVEQWASVVPVDMTILPGMSGGAILSDAGEVVGIVVGIVVFTTLVGDVPTGLGLAVPSEVVCGLLGR